MVLDLHDVTVDSRRVVLFEYVFFYLRLKTDRGVIQNRDALC